MGSAEIFHGFRGRDFCNPLVFKYFQIGTYDAFSIGNRYNFRNNIVTLQTRNSGKRCLQEHYTYSL